jgi:hypothetical protein
MNFNNGNQNFFQKIGTSDFLCLNFSKEKI